jgi:hypothetical protein
MFIPSIATYTHEKRKHVYKHHDIRPFTDYRNPDETAPTYDDYEYAIDHWNIWTTIARQEAEDRSYRDTSSDIYMIMDSDTEYHRSLSNSSLVFNQLMRFIKESDVSTQTELRVLRNWDMILLSHQSTAPYPTFDKTHFVYINTTIGIPSDHIRFNGNYLLSSRGLRKLIASRFHKNLIPLPEFIVQLHDGTFPKTHIQHSGFNSTSTNTNTLEGENYLRLFHTVQPVFHRWNRTPTSVPYRCKQVKSFRYQRIDTVWSFIITISPHIPNEYFEYMKQYGLFYGIPVIQIDFEQQPHTLPASTSSKHTMAMSILANLHDVYRQVSDPEHILVLYCGNRMAFPNCIPSLLLERFIAMNRSFVYCNYSSMSDLNLTLDDHIADGIWMTKFNDLFLDGTRCNTHDVYENLNRVAYSDTNSNLFFDITHIHRHVSLDFQKETRQIIFTENETKREIVAPFVSSSICDGEIWTIFIKLYNMIQIQHPMNIPFEVDSNQRIRPPLYGNQMFQYGTLSIYMPMSNRCIRMFRKSGIKKWFDMIHRALNISDDRIDEIRTLYVRSTHNEPIISPDTSSSNVPYQWAYHRGYITRRITIYMRTEDDYHLFLKTYKSEIDSIRNLPDYGGSDLSITYTPSFLRLLQDDLIAGKHTHSDYIWFVNPSHVLEPNTASYIAETQCRIIAPCIGGRHNNYVSASCYNDISGTQVVQDGELVKFISHQCTGVWNMVYIQDTWCIHSTMFERIASLLANEVRNPTESWEQFMMRIFHKHQVPVYACNRYRYGIDVDY